MGADGQPKPAAPVGRGRPLRTPPATAVRAGAALPSSGTSCASWPSASSCTS
jgi:hypothetical protein